MSHPATARRGRASVRVLGLLALLAASGGGAVADPSATQWDSAIGPPFQLLIERVATRHSLEPKLLAALVEAESARDAEAVSHAGAIGLAQLMPATARRFGVLDITDPAQNLEGGARYLAWLIERFDGDIPLALAAYNAGEGAVDRHGGIPPYRETQGFVRRVLRKAGLSHLKPGTPSSEAARRAGPPPRVVVDDGGTITLTNVPRR